MRCVRLSWRINHDFTLKRSAWPEKKQRETDRGIETKRKGALNDGGRGTAEWLSERKRGVGGERED